MTEAGAGLPPSISQMPAWLFWTRAVAIDSSDEESARMAAGQVPEPRATELRTKAKEAFERLRDMPIPGIEGWMHCHRAMN